jgi:hypothetical protein
LVLEIEIFAEVGVCEQRRNFISRGERLLVDEQIFDFAECHARPQARRVPNLPRIVSFAPTRG